MPGPLNTAGGGVSQGMPDVINTPTPAGPVPIPCMNTAVGPNNNPSSTVLKVLIDGSPAENIMSEKLCSVTTGAGAGVVSGMVNGPGRNMQGSARVMMANAPATGLSDMTTHNGSCPNTTGTCLVPSQVKVIKQS
ncbi:DUF4150 domain-containing protein [Vibrio profundum]|uniref:PAAR-like domain-containing protein n=1 Tax=Vibrio profundum TaxID=2910247 RepID=UPI003D0F2A9F